MENTTVTMTNPAAPREEPAADNPCIHCERCLTEEKLLSIFDRWFERLENRAKKPTLTFKEAAEYLHIHENTLYTHPEIPRVRIGGRVLFRRETLDKLIADEKVPNKAGRPCKK